MNTISKKALNLDVDVIKEIRDNTLELKPDVLRVCVGYYHYNFAYYNINSKIDKAIIFYKGKYKKDLNQEERTILALYFVISNDKEFLLDLANVKNDISELCSKYGVSKEFIYLRLNVLLKVKKHDKEFKKLNLSYGE